MSQIKPSQHALSIAKRLLKMYPDATYELNWQNPLQLLVATILAARCTDERVNRATPALFAHFPTAASYANAPVEEIEKFLSEISFYRIKAQTLKDVGIHLVNNHGGSVPPSMDALTALPRVARKTANVVLNVAFRQPSGIIVDTHGIRVSGRFGLTTQTKPEKIEADLMKLIPRDQWISFGPALVLHGRYTCTASEPKCNKCTLADLCPRIGVAEARRSQTVNTSANAKAKPTSQVHSLLKTKSANPADNQSAAALPPDWAAVLADELNQPYWAKLQEFVEAERAAGEIYPAPNEVFTAFHLTPFSSVSVLILGQDPYHDVGQAHGLCFSVKPGITPPPSLKNIYKELHNDLGIRPAKHGYLRSWAEQGVLMLNAVLTVRAHSPNSHKDRGWETFTDAVIKALNARPEPVIFVLWGGYAQKKGAFIDTNKHTILQAAHPSPLSAKNGFFGSKPFSKINAALTAAGRTPISWSLPESPT